MAIEKKIQFLIILLRESTFVIHQRMAKLSNVALHSKSQHESNGKKILFDLKKFNLPSFCIYFFAHNWIITIRMIFYVFEAGHYISL